MSWASGRHFADAGKAQKLGYKFSLRSRSVEEAIAQLRADAFTAGEAVGIERAANVAMNAPLSSTLTKDERLLITVTSEHAHNRIRSLSPDPDYLTRVKRDVWEQAARICDKEADQWAAAAGDEGPEEWAHRQAAIAKKAEASYLAATLRSQVIIKQDQSP